MSTSLRWATTITLLLWTAPLAWALGAQPVARPSAGATVYKCDGAAGSVVYQDSPCAPGTELRNFATDPPMLSVIPGTAPPPPPPASSAKIRADRVAIPVRARESAGNAGERRYIRVGMSQAEVLQRLGRPDVEARNQRGKGQRWSYLPRTGDATTITTVTLVDGKVADVERKIVR